MRVCSFRPDAPSRIRRQGRAHVWPYLGIGSCVLVLPLNIAFRKKQIYLPLVFVVAREYLFCLVRFLFRTFFGDKRSQLLETIGSRCICF